MRGEVTDAQADKPYPSLEAIHAAIDKMKDGDRQPPVETSVMSIGIIDVPENRLRDLNMDEVRKTAESIKTLGLLQPIGVVAKKDGSGRYKVVFGWHRFAAVKLIIEQGLKPPNCFVVLPSDMTDDEILMAELAENLHRFDLTPKQRAEQTLRYAALLKKSNKVQGRREKQRSTKAKKSETKANVNRLTTTEKPTVTDKTSQDLGVSRQGLDKRVKAAAKIAKRAGVDMGSDSPTLENMSAETLEKVADAVKNAPEREEEAVREISTAELKRPKTAQEEDSFERAKRINGEVSKYEAKLLSLMMPPLWRDIDSGRRPKLLANIRLAVAKLTLAIEAYEE